MFFSVPNVSATEAKPVERPWDLAMPGYPEHIDKGTKLDFRAWCAAGTTKHTFLSMYEGMSAGVRVSEENPPQMCHGVIVDYDASGFSVEEVVRAVENKPAAQFHPSWLVVTFSGNYRLVWEFERPVVISNLKLAQEFQKQARAELKVIKWINALDEVIKVPQQYYELGRKWIALKGSAKIPAGYVWSWASKAARNLVLAKGDSALEIPIEVIAQAVQEKFPGRWKGDFNYDSYGIRFWDPTADCPNGCQVRKWGMQAYSRGPHMSWADIFGRDWVKKFEADRLGPILETSFFDGQRFWVWNEYTREYNDIAKDDFSQKLRVRGFDGRKEKNKTMSEVDLVEMQVKEQKRVASAQPFIHRPKGMLQYNGNTFLNNSSRTCLPPAPPGSVRDLLHAKTERFPWTYRFLHGFFNPAEQLEYFLGWLKWFYENGLRQEPKQGQAIVLVGPASKGKTFLSTKLVADMVGGNSDATAYLVDGNPFSATVARYPLMCVDDSKSTTDMRAHAQYSAAVKRLVANRTIVCNEKYLKAAQVEWLGRVIITCNPDPESLRIIPSIEISNIDKICLFRCSDELDDTLFKSPEETSAILAQELPYFCRWLLDWELPAHILNRSNTRFGVVPYHHKGLYEAALSHGRSHTFLEILMDFLQAAEEYNKLQGTAGAGWRGTASQLYKEMQIAYQGHNEHLRKYDAQSMSICLGNLMARGYNITCVRSKGLSEWVIPPDLHQGDAAGVEESASLKNIFDVPRPEAEG
jgi:hypothetical protein